MSRWRRTPDEQAALLVELRERVAAFRAIEPAITRHLDDLAMDDPVDQRRVDLLRLNWHAARSRILRPERG